MPEAVGSQSVPAQPSGYAFFDSEIRDRYRIQSLAGVDEVGRGPLAGPVVAAAVVLPAAPLPQLEGVKDSKQLTEAKREALFSVIWKSALQVGVGYALPVEIDKKNILNATYLAMRRALGALTLDPDAQIVLVDGNQEIPELGLKQLTVIGGDAKSLAIASASVVAKVARDRWMARLERLYPGYGFAKHKGYGTADHYKAIEAKGVSLVHRKSFLTRLNEPELGLQRN